MGEKTKRSNKKAMMKFLPSSETVEKYLEKLKEVMHPDALIRRSRLDLNAPAELAIRNAVDEVEKIGVDIKLTNAIILLNQARELVADYIDNK